jgi:hypothetical protein
LIYFQGRNDASHAIAALRIANIQERQATGVTFDDGDGGPVDDDQPEAEITENDEEEEEDEEE